MDDEATCETCPAFVEAPNQPDGEKKVGQCRRIPPQTVFAGFTQARGVISGAALAGNPSAQLQPIFDARMPVVPTDFWCLEHPERKLAAYGADET